MTKENNNLHGGGEGVGRENSGDGKSFKRDGWTGIRQQQPCQILGHLPPDPCPAHEGTPRHAETHSRHVQTKHIQGNPKIEMGEGGATVLRVTKKEVSRL